MVRVQQAGQVLIVAPSTQQIAIKMHNDPTMSIYPAFEHHKLYSKREMHYSQAE